MTFNPAIHHRQSIRLQEFDYAQAGWYFITICTHDRLPLFGEVVMGEMVLNDAGKMVTQWWEELSQKFKNIQLHEHVTMPNHFHGILQIITCEQRQGAQAGMPRRENLPDSIQKNASVSEMVQWFKTMTTNAYIRGVKSGLWLPFCGKVWQRNFYEHVIRDETAYLSIADYIHTNPMRWGSDIYYV